MFHPSIDDSRAGSPPLMKRDRKKSGSIDHAPNYSFTRVRKTGSFHTVGSCHTLSPICIFPSPTRSSDSFVRTGSQPQPQPQEIQALQAMPPFYRDISAGTVENGSCPGVSHFCGVIIERWSTRAAQSVPSFEGSPRPDSVQSACPSFVRSVKLQEVYDRKGVYLLSAMDISYLYNMNPDQHFGS